MHILIYSRVFLPSVGGTEEVVRLLAEQFSGLGHAVTVATETAGALSQPQPYRIVRHPRLFTLFRLAREADVCLMIGASLRAAPAVILAGCPLVVSHHIYPEKWGKEPPRLGWRFRLKRTLKRKVSSLGPNIFPSQALCNAMGEQGRVIRNPFDAARFGSTVKRRDRDLIFIGRMIPDKGCDDLIDAVELLVARGIRPSVTLVGSGPEKPTLERKVRERGLGSSISFAGQFTGAPLASELGRHRILVVPSRCPEAFGIVALEGMASGCAVIGTNAGGLPEAIGAGGIVVPPANVVAIADAIGLLLKDKRLREQLSRAGIAQTANHTPLAVAKEYLSVLEPSRRATKSEWSDDGRRPADPNRPK